MRPDLFAVVQNLMTREAGEASSAFGVQSVGAANESVDATEAHRLRNKLGVVPGFNHVH